MATAYERLRELNISRNNELLDGLSLGQSKEKIGRKELPRKRRKIVLAPTRPSTRLSSQPRPSYQDTVDDTVEEVRESPRPERDIEEVEEGWK